MVTDVSKIEQLDWKVIEELKLNKIEPKYAHSYLT